VRSTGAGIVENGPARQPWRKAAITWHRDFRRKPASDHNFCGFFAILHNLYGIAGWRLNAYDKYKA